MWEGIVRLCVWILVVATALAVMAMREEVIRARLAPEQIQPPTNSYGRGQCREPYAGEMLASYKWCNELACYTSCSIEPFDPKEVGPDRVWHEDV